jgi:hypothetical protein
LAAGNGGGKNAAGKDVACDSLYVSQVFADTHFAADRDWRH